MDSDLRALYQDVILDHGRTPRNHFKLDPSDYDARGYNPLCGDDIHVYVRDDAKAGIISRVSFTGRGCAISQASASMMTEILQGKSKKYFQELFIQFHRLCTGEEVLHVDNAQTAPEWWDDLDRLRVLSGVCEFPSRVKCATLAWHAMSGALRGEQQTKTE